VGIPTYNRVEGLRGAVESALSQDHPRVEVVISDNGSEDGTQAYAEALAARDPRVRYVRHAQNRGLVANFLAALEHATGPYFCWLADDDRLGPGTLGTCVGFLEAHPDHAVAVGRVLTVGPGGPEAEERLGDLSQESPAERTRAYYGQIGCNAYIYGVVRTDLLRRCPFEVTLGNDWNLVASLAFLGRVKSVVEASLLRKPHGASKDIRHLARVLGVPALQHRFPHLSLPFGTYRSIARRSPVYGALGPLGRRVLAARCAAVVYRIYVWPHVVERAGGALRRLSRPHRLFERRGGVRGGGEGSAP